MEEEDDTGGINLDKAKERLQEEDKFDKEEYRKKIKAKHRVSFLEDTDNVTLIPVFTDTCFVPVKHCVCSYCSSAGDYIILICH